MITISLFLSLTMQNNGYLNEVTGVADKGDTWAQHHRLQLTKADLATIICKHPVCLQKTPMLNFEYGNKPWD